MDVLRGKTEGADSTCVEVDSQDSPGCKTVKIYQRGKPVNQLAVTETEQLYSIHERALESVYCIEITTVLQHQP